MCTPVGQGCPLTNSQQEQPPCSPRAANHSSRQPLGITGPALENSCLESAPLKIPPPASNWEPSLVWGKGHWARSSKSSSEPRPCPVTDCLTLSGAAKPSPCRVKVSMTIWASGPRAHLGSKVSAGVSCPSPARLPCQGPVSYRQWWQLRMGWPRARPPPGPPAGLGGTSGPVLGQQAGTYVRGGWAPCPELRKGCLGTVPRPSCSARNSSLLRIKGERGAWAYSRPPESQFSSSAVSLGLGEGFPGL